MAELNDLGQPVGARVNFTAPAALSPVSLIGRTVTLDPIQATDLPLLHEAFQEDETGANWTYLPSGPFPDYASFAENFAGFLHDPSLIPFVMRVGGRVAGMACYLRMVPEFGAVEIGYVHFSPRMQRTPSSTEAIFLMADHAFTSGYRRLEWKCNALNAPSRRAAERLGFCYEGTFRQDRVYKGRNRDTAWFSILDGEWPDYRAKITAWLDPSNFDADGTQMSPLRVRP